MPRTEGRFTEAPLVSSRGARSHIVQRFVAQQEKFDKEFPSRVHKLVRFALDDADGSQIPTSFYITPKHFDLAELSYNYVEAFDDPRVLDRLKKCLGNEGISSIVISWDADGNIKSIKASIWPDSETRKREIEEEKSARSKYMANDRDESARASVFDEDDHP